MRKEALCDGLFGSQFTFGNSYLHSLGTTLGTCFLAGFCRIFLRVTALSFETLIDRA